MEEQISEQRHTTGAEVLDMLLEGGYENSIIHTLYGPAGSGKTNICMISALTFAGLILGTRASLAG